MQEGNNRRSRVVAWTWRHPKLSVIGVLALAGVLVLSAWAAWTKTQTVVPGKAATASLVAPSFTAVTGVPLFDMYPGAPATATFHITGVPGRTFTLNSLNSPGADPHGVGVTNDAATVSGSQAACPVNNIFLNGVVLDGLAGRPSAITIGPTYNQDVTIAGAVSLDAAAPTGCQGVTWTIPSGAGTNNWTATFTFVS